MPNGVFRVHIEWLQESYRLSLRHYSQTVGVIILSRTRKVALGCLFLGHLSLAPYLGKSKICVWDRNTIRPACAAPASISLLASFLRPDSRYALQKLEHPFNSSNLRPDSYHLLNIYYISGPVLSLTHFSNLMRKGPYDHPYFTEKQI